MSLICILASLFIAPSPLLASPTLVDPSLKVQTWARGLDSPTGLAILGDGNMLVTEKQTGRVKVVFGKTVVGTALDLNVANSSEQGLLGIATPRDFATNNHVYLYYTAASADGGTPTANRIDRYTWNAGSKTLAFDRPIKNLPGGPGPNHNGGKITFGLDGKLYAQVGDLNRNEATTNHTTTVPITRAATILRLNPSGTAPTNNPFYNPKSPRSPYSDIYASGVRNGFGLAFDPQTNDLWDTENGAASWDEINLVRPGFNSGWEDTMGPTSRTGADLSGLISLGEKSKYSDPNFAWSEPVAPTDLEFMNTGRLGGGYNGDLFVGILRTGSLLRFDLTKTRKSLSLNGALADRVADNSESNFLAEQSSQIFGTGFGTISDLTVGPGGMYVLSLNGTLYRITTADIGAGQTLFASGLLSKDASAVSHVAIPEPRSVFFGMIASVICVLQRPCSRGFTRADSDRRKRGQARG